MIDVSAGKPAQGEEAVIAFVVAVAIVLAVTVVAVVVLGRVVVNVLVVAITVVDVAVVDDVTAGQSPSLSSISCCEVRRPRCAETERHFLAAPCQPHSSPQ